jgi:hypothetical protein
MKASQRSPENMDAVNLAQQGVQAASESTLQSALSSPAPGEETQPDELEALRSLVSAPERARVARLEAEVAKLDARSRDRDALIAAITPILGDVIRHKIQDSRDEMIEVLYPILGQLIGRAVSEAIRDLARTVDARMRSSFDPQVIVGRLRARALGVPESSLMLRDALPFQVTEVFLIERQSGLLLQYLCRDPEEAADSDLISGMLTAIRDFAQDTFGRDREGQLDEIQYGSRLILIEASRHAYLAVVMDGVAPSGFRASVRERIMDFENEYAEILAHFDGDNSRIEAFKPVLSELLTGLEPRESEREHGLTRSQKRIIVIVAGLPLACLLTICIGGILTLRSMIGRPR